jgi:hypothetical protein
MKRIIFALLLVFSLNLMFLMIAHAQDVPPVDPSSVLVDSSLDLVALVEQLIEQITGLDLDVEQFVGVAALVTVIVNVLKMIKINGSPLIPDGYGGLAALIGEVVVVVIAAVAGLVSYDLFAIDNVLLTVAQIVAAVLALFATSLIIHKVGREAELPTFKPR